VHLSFAVLVLIPGRPYLWYAPGMVEHDFATSFCLILCSTIACIASSKCLSAASFWCVKAAGDDLLVLIIYKEANCDKRYNESYVRLSILMQHGRECGAPMVNAEEAK